MENDRAYAVKIAARWMDGIYILPPEEILSLVIDQWNRMRYAVLNNETYGG